ncbi:MAG: hypothetical protein JXQ71_01465 [Verrucomicrobia bacterium]|nr:hypothetical protein [Verrucomicrobiota bacterium]
MSEHEKQTTFLLQCLVYDGSAERQELEDGIVQILRDERCLRRAMWLMALLMALVLAGLGYTAVLVDGFLQNLPPFLVRVVGVLGLASLLSLLGFAGLRFLYRHKLNGRREACRRLAVKLLESRLGTPRTWHRPEVANETQRLASAVAAIPSWLESEPTSAKTHP